MFGNVDYMWALSEGLVTTALGMVIVFIVLTMLIGVLQAVGNVFAMKQDASE